MATPKAVFDDEIYRATDLNRQSGHILDRAAEHPVTIIRNDEKFALLQRDIVSGLFQGAKIASTMAGLVKAAGLYLSGKSVEASPYEWVRELPPAGVQEMIQELATIFQQAECGRVEWRDFEAVLQEWEESAWARRSPELAAAFAAEPDEAPLTAPPVAAEPE